METLLVMWVTVGRSTLERLIVEDSLMLRFNASFHMIYNQYVLSNGCLLMAFLLILTKDLDSLVGILSDLFNLTSLGRLRDIYFLLRYEV